MLPPIHSLSRSGDARGNTAFNKRGVFSSKVSSGFTQDRSEVASTNSVDDRLRLLEEENAQVREEIDQLRRQLTNNLQSGEDKTMIEKAYEDVQQVIHALSAKTQADSLFHQQEKHKGALLFAEVSRLGCLLESLEKKLRHHREESERRLDQHEQHLDKLASLCCKNDPPRSSPTKQAQEEIVRQAEELQWMKCALTQLRTEVESDRNERWKIESERSHLVADLRVGLAKAEMSMDARIASQLESIHQKIVNDKADVVRALDELRDLIKCTDLKRAAIVATELYRVNDHFTALEGWIFSEHEKIRLVLQSLRSTHDSSIEGVVNECSSIVQLLITLMVQIDEDWSQHGETVRDAMTEFATFVQHRIGGVEESMTIEVKARQSDGDQLRQRLYTELQEIRRSFEVTQSNLVASYTLDPLNGIEQIKISRELQGRINGVERALEQITKRIEDFSERVEKEGPTVVKVAGVDELVDTSSIVRRDVDAAGNSPNSVETKDLVAPTITSYNEDKPKHSLLEKQS